MKYKKYLYHFLFWTGIYLFWVLIFQKRIFALTTTATIEFCYLIFVAGNYYFNVNVAIPRFLYKRRYIEFAALFLAGIAAASALRVPLASWLNANYFLSGKPQPSHQAIFISSFTNIFIWVVLLVSGYIIVDRFRFQRYVDAIEKEKSQAELDLLNAQLNPHFLFNSINSIYEAIDKQNKGARDILLNFSELLRYQLYECNTPSIDIAKEIDYLKNYIQLQKVRKGDQLSVDFTAGDNLKGFRIAPLLFIAFIENAFKHVGPLSSGDLKIEISFRKEENDLFFSCMNTRAGIRTSADSHQGIGLANVKRRLALHYRSKHELKIDNQPDHFYVLLKIQLA